MTTCTSVTVAPGMPFYSGTALVEVGIEVGYSKRDVIACVPLVPFWCVVPWCVIEKRGVQTVVRMSNFCSVDKVLTQGQPT